jgi:hypothetical protein
MLNTDKLHDLSQILFTDQTNVNDFEGACSKVGQFNQQIQHFNWRA